jgi:hypothetical protein
MASSLRLNAGQRLVFLQKFSPGEKPEEFLGGIP